MLPSKIVVVWIWIIFGTMPSPTPGFACLKLLYWEGDGDELKVPVFNVILALLPTVSVAVLLWGLNTTNKYAQPEVQSCVCVCGAVFFFSKMPTVVCVVQLSGTTRARFKRGDKPGCCGCCKLCCCYCCMG